VRSLRMAKSWQRGVPEPGADPEASSWRFRGRCADTDPELFFPTRPARRQVSRAKAVCAQCPVKAECLEWALTTGQIDGVWGGLDEKERAVLRRRRPTKSFVAAPDDSGRQTRTV
jgi:WhiB family transcriptional regulator, redox-sensing transcriptional regulator